MSLNIDFPVFQLSATVDPLEAFGDSQAAASASPSSSGVMQLVPSMPKAFRSSRVNEDDDDEKEAIEYSSPPYIFCNEQGQEKLIPDLKAMKLSNGCHFGFAGWLNYDIMAVTRAKYGVVCDINPRMFDFYKIFQEKIAVSSGREQFVNRLKEALDPEHFDNGFLWMLSDELYRNGSWLSSDEDFVFIRDMHINKEVEYLKLNAKGDSAEYQKICARIPCIHTIYTSNIFEWLEKDDIQARDRFKENMRVLLKLETVYIDAFYPHVTSKGMLIQDGSGPPLRFTLGDLPQFSRTRLKRS